jgi:hypothetical protein
MEGTRSAAAGSDRVRLIPVERSESRADDEAIVESPAAFRWLIRGGFFARGLTYAVIGVLALALALGLGRLGTEPNQEGALALIARAQLGRAAMVVIASGLLAYAVWKLWQALLGTGPEGGGGKHIKDRAANLGGGIVYIGFFAVAVRVLISTSDGGSRQARDTAAGVLAWPAGQIVVGLAGVALLVISLYQAWDGVCGGFAEHCKVDEMSREARHALMWLGRVGLVARALVFGLVGYFLLRTALEFKAKNAVGVDGALDRLRDQPLGPWLLAIVAVGLLVFALFSLFEGRYRRL